MDRGIYSTFFIHWTLEFCIICRNAAILVTVGSLYVGLCLYTLGMVADLKAEMAFFGETTSVSESAGIRLIYVKAVVYHSEIIG